MKLIDDVVAGPLAAEIRARLERRGWKRYALLDRASFEWVDAPDEPELFGRLATLASTIAGRPLSVAESRAVRLLPGDYAFVRHDRVYDDGPIELVVDLSPAMVPGAEVHYRHRGQVFFVVPSRPGIAGVVERGPTVMRNSTYVSKRLPEAEVVRVFLLLR